MVAVNMPAIAGSRTKTVRLDRIRLDGDTQSRNELDEQVIKEYAGLLLDGHEFPPLLVVFDGDNYWLVDGFHRRWAAVNAKVDKFRCQIVNGTREHARWLSYSVNKTHGLPRTNEDKAKAVTAALTHPKGVKLSDGKIAEHVGVAVTTVGKYRTKLGPTIQIGKSQERIGRDGRTTNTANIGKKKKQKSKPSASNGAPAMPSTQPAKDDVHDPEPTTEQPSGVFVELRRVFDSMSNNERKQAALMWEGWLGE